MRNLLRRAVPGLLLAALLGTPAWAQNRVGTVDMRRLFEDYYKTKAARAQLDEVKADMEKEHGSMVEDFKKLKDDYQAVLASANDQAVSTDERDKRKKLAEEKLRQVKKADDDLVGYEHQAQTRLQDQYARVRDKVIEEIRVVLDAKAKASGYSLLLDSSALSATGIPVVLYRNNGDDDLTQATLAQLNAAAPPEPSKTPEKGPEKKKR